jgi:hypothetical protein
MIWVWVKMAWKAEIMAIQSSAKFLDMKGGSKRKLSPYSDLPIYM